jgi:hypothetical protein
MRTRTSRPVVLVLLQKNTRPDEKVAPVSFSDYVVFVCWGPFSLARQPKFGNITICHTNTCGIMLVQNMFIIIGGLAVEDLSEKV